MTCYFCDQEVTDKVEYHHPDKTRFPDWTEPAHPECHTRYHSRNGHFRAWGARSPYAGRPGYERAIAKWPGFHRMGGLARARTAERDALGRFT